MSVPKLFMGLKVSVKIEHLECDGYPKTAVLELIKAQGKYKMIGCGSFGDVFGAKNSNIVYKAGYCDSNKPYLAYIKTLIKQKKHNPFTPKIYGVRIYTNKNCASDGDKCGDVSYFVVAMERLKSLKHKYEPVRRWIADEVYNEYTLNAEAFKAAGVIRKLDKKVEDVFKILDESFKLASKEDKWADWDLHDGNFMMRGDQIVVTDPLA